MDHAIEMSKFLPASFRSQEEESYVALLWDAFESNYSQGKYEFASFAFHLLYMTYVSFSIWQIRLVREHDFKNALVGFQSESEIKLLSAGSPFEFYERLKESQIFRFLKLVGCTNDDVGEFAKFVKRRNRIAHPSGTVFFNNQATIDAEIVDMMREVANIQTHMQPIIVEVYRAFLSASSDIDSREYADPNEEVRVSLIHRNYISQKDIEVCLAFDVSVYQAEQNFSEIQALHSSLQASYGSA